MKPLSEHFAKLSEQSKIAEDRVAVAQSQIREQLDRQRDQVRREAEQALGELKQQFDEAKGETRTRLEALHTKVDGDFEQMRQRANQAKRKFESWQADNYATDREADAIAAIDYAIASTKLAELLTLDAIAARAEAEGKAEMVQPERITV